MASKRQNDYLMETIILGRIDSLNEIGWFKQDLSGEYRITRKGKSNTIVLSRWEVNIDMRDKGDQ